MKRKDSNNLDENISRLVKLTGDSDKPSKSFLESLTNKALQGLKGHRGRKIPFTKSAWISAAAAVLVIGALLLLVQDSAQEKPGQPGIVQDQQITKKPDADKIGDERFYREASERQALLSKAEEKAGAGVKSPFITDVETAAREISEKPPFAPASAIELVTLPRRDNVQITIYNSADLTLVRERRNLTLKRGWNWLQFMWANTLIDPTSLSLEPLEWVDKIDIQQLVFPARLKCIGRWLIRSEVEGQVPFEITYFTSGLSWRAFYMGTLSKDETAMALKGYVHVSNGSGEDYEDAQTRLIVGQVHLLDRIAELASRQYPYESPLRPIDYEYKLGWGDIRRKAKDELLEFDDKGAVINGFCAPKPKAIRKEGLSEYFLYTIEGTETIPDRWGKRLLSFDVNDIAVKGLYKYDEERFGKQAVRYIAFTNDQEHNLGQTPIPNGNVKIYSIADEKGHLSYTGGTNIKYIPVDEEVELNLGAARLVKVEPVLMDFRTENFVFDANGNITGWDEVRRWKIEIINTRQLPVEIEITRGFETAYWILELDGEEVSYEKHDANHARFRLKPGPRSKRAFEYTVTTYHGTREEIFAEQF